MLRLKSNHKIMCGDSTNADDVAKLMDGEKADMVFTSPPYAQQREYGTAKEVVKNWDKLMAGVSAVFPVSNDGQIFVNLGLVHRNGEFWEYWRDWLDSMPSLGWKKFGWYVWDQLSGLPGDWNGRFGPSFEFIWHFNKKPRKANKIVKKLDESCNRTGRRTVLRGKDGVVQEINSPETTRQPMKIHDSVIRQNRHLANDIARLNHPATFPIALPQVFIESFTHENELCYEPFLGSGSTLIACEKTGRRCFGMELDEHYCSVIIERFQHFTGERAVKCSD